MAIIGLLAQCAPSPKSQQQPASICEPGLSETLPDSVGGLKTMRLIPEANLIWVNAQAGWPIHEVTLDPFYMDETPVTYADFSAYVKDGDPCLATGNIHLTTYLISRLQD